MPYYIVFLYCDYRKEIGVQHLKVYTDREEAIAFAKKYTSRSKETPQYVGPCGTEYDAPFLGAVNDDHDDYEKEQEEYDKAKQELGIKPIMWYIRIAVSRVD